MSKPIIEVKGISKRYKLGTIGAQTMREEVEAFFARFKKTKAFDDGNAEKLKTETLKTSNSAAGSSDFWALRDVSFDVQSGEVVGIIGRNGAGKSTLLKILSRITEPTSGEIRVRGRIASLLEVGTGFHPELSGRENIFLNGAILGMTKSEIRAKFNEIIDFAGVEQFIDTPVKRYSSGMYVRLAFAVAAHLEPEILIVDEVLAVGDAEFQKKCLGKMKEVSGSGGRTVLFVSHNMTAVQSLCDRAVFMNTGRVEEIGPPEPLIKKYLSLFGAVRTSRDYSGSGGDDVAALRDAALLDPAGRQAVALDFHEGGSVRFTYEIFKSGFLPIPNAHFFNEKGEYVMVVGEENSNVSGQPGTYSTEFKIPPHFLNTGRYSVGICIATQEPEIIHHWDQEGLLFDVLEDMEKRGSHYRNSIPGNVRPRFEWNTRKIQ